VVLIAEHHDLVEDARLRAGEATQHILNYELRAAWRMGYDYIHVYGDSAPYSGGPGREIAVRCYTLMSNQRPPPEPDGCGYRYSYDLTDISDSAFWR